MGSPVRGDGVRVHVPGLRESDVQPLVSCEQRHEAPAESAVAVWDDGGDADRRPAGAFLSEGSVCEFLGWLPAWPSEGGVQDGSVPDATAYSLSEADADPNSESFAESFADAYAQSESDADAIAHAAASLLKHK